MTKGLPGSPAAVVGDVVLHVPGADDAGPLGRMHLRSWHETYPSAEHGIDAGWIDEHSGFLASPAADDFRRGLFAAQDAAPGRTFYRVARRGRDVVGFVHASRPEPGQAGTPAGEDATLEALYLLRDHQGTGLADRMMAAALGWLDGQPVRLEVATYNARAIRFYERHGLRPTGERALFRQRVPISVMRRDPRR